MFNGPLRANPIKVIEEKDNLYLYIVETNGLFQIDDTVLEICRSEGKKVEEIYELLNHRSTKEDVDSLLTNLETASVIQFDDSSTNEVFHNYTDEKLSISSIILMLVQECNLRCSYCYGGDGEYNDKGRMDTETALRAVDYLFDQSGEEEELNICFFGGEPLLNFKVIKEIVAYTKTKQKSSNKKVTYSMTTNGTLISKEIEIFLLDHHVSTQISLDGDRETHDYNRYFQNRKGTYDTILKKTKNLREKGGLTARATVSPVQLNITHTFTHLMEIGIHNVAMYPAVEMLNEEDFEKYASEFTKLVGYFESLIQAKQYRDARQISNILKYLRMIHSSSTRHYFCGAVSHMLAVDVHGNLYPCQRFVKEKNYSLGNVKDGLNAKKKSDTLSELRLEMRTTCADCWAKNLCGGGCPQENLVFSGSINKPVDKYCNFIRSEIMDCLKLYLRLTEEDKRNLFPAKRQQKPILEDVSIGN
ncbi:PapB family radical SAM/SPASM ranthipeptide maturase [Paenibacillus sp. 1-18]|uniref:PapB family radical SAM/SPASM ranthipeptide maturase n=1 Tax=Paenibacillus sp. 1-18 TaxID=1333846 RepID=UPI00046E9D31|nr:radical SAM protein [Paenibacillus sp. 1-18]